MRFGISVGVVSCAMALVLMVPGNSMALGTPGTINGNLANDPRWSASPGWCCVMEQNDVNEGEWWTGFTFYDVSYKANAQDNWDSYIKEITIPWIGIQMEGDNMVRYNYSETTSSYHIYFNGTYTYHPWLDQPGERYTSLDVDYELDFDGDSVIDWRIWERIEFHPIENPPVTGYFFVEYQIKQYPTIMIQGQPYWGHDGVKVETIDVPILFNPDVYDTPSNDFSHSSNGGANWAPVNTETAYTGFNMMAKATNDLPNPDVDLVITPIPNQCSPTNQIFTYLFNEGNEFAHQPGSYDDDHSIQDQDGLIWYVETYDVQTDEPPNQNDGSMSGIYCDGFVA